MALNLEEQLQVQSGELKPTAVEESLINLAKAASINYAREFNPNHKVITYADPQNPTANELNAEAYLSKMLRATNSAVTANGSGAVALNNAIASYIARDATDVAQIENGTQAQWEQFITDNIDEAVELFAGVKVQEKTAYDNY